MEANCQNALSKIATSTTLDTQHLEKKIIALKQHDKHLI